MMTEGKGDHSVLDIRDGGIVMQTCNENKHEDELLASMIGAKLSQLLPPPIVVPTCIFRIPRLLRRDADEECFVPSVVSIGPLHHGEDNLKSMEEVKLLYLQGLLDRKPTPATSLHNFVKEIISIEQDCRNCYDEKFPNFSSEKFVEMMVVDGCFVIEFFRKFVGEVLKPKGDPVFYDSWMLFAIKSDLLLVENQLPWRVLNCLFHLTSEASKVPLPELTLKYFKKCTLGLSDLHAGNAALPTKHLLAFFCNCLHKSSAESETQKHGNRTSIPSAKELVQHGVFIRPGSDHNMCKVTFGDTVLSIPPINVHKNGESVFRNLRAYSQLEPSNNSELISYFVLLDDLIRCDVDVKILISSGIIRHVAAEDIRWFAEDRFNTVGLIDNFSYSGLYCDLDRFLHVPFNMWKGRLRSVLFKSPWDIINMCVVIILVTTFTFLQTLFAIMSYYK